MVQATNGAAVGIRKEMEHMQLRNSLQYACEDRVSALNSGFKSANFQAVNNGIQDSSWEKSFYWKHVSLKR
jgi:hypothetical protein